MEWSVHRDNNTNVKVEADVAAADECKCLEIFKIVSLYYANGDFGCVTTLVAIILDNVSCIGVICKPFGQEDKPTILNSGCYTLYGGTLLKDAYVAGGDECQRKTGGSETEDDDDDVNDDPSILLRQNNCAIIFHSCAGGVGTSLWDVAAADAILRAIGGRLSDKDGNDIDYSKSRQNAENVEGIIACNDSWLHQECVRLFQEEQWGDDDDG
eukprot:15336762-Ditylum_brightwellii.AAC.1